MPNEETLGRSKRLRLALLLSEICDLSLQQGWRIAGKFISVPAKLRTLEFLLRSFCDFPQSIERIVVARILTVLSNIESPVYSLALHLSGKPQSEPEYKRFEAEFLEWFNNLPYVDNPSSIKPFLRRFDGLRILVCPYQHKFNPRRFKCAYAILSRIRHCT